MLVPCAAGLVGEAFASGYSSEAIEFFESIT